MSQVAIDWVQPIARTINIDGQQVEILPLRVGQLPLALRLVKPLLADLSAVPTGALDAIMAGTAGPVEQGEVLVWLVNAVATNGAAVIDLVALACKLDATVVGNLYADRLAALALLVVEVNADFFGRVAPALKGLAAGIKLPGQANKSPTGQISSSS